jgi:hypothetical protein
MMEAPVVLTSNGKPVAGESLPERNRASETESLSAVMTVFGVSRKVPVPRTNWTGLGTMDRGLFYAMAGAANRSNGASNDSCRARESFSDSLIILPPEEWTNSACTRRRSRSPQFIVPPRLPDQIHASLLSQLEIFARPLVERHLCVQPCTSEFTA